MGIWDAFSEIVEAVTPWSVVEAEAPAEETQVGGMSFWEERERERQKKYYDALGQLCRPEKRGRSKSCRATSELQYTTGRDVHFLYGPGAN